MTDPKVDMSQLVERLRATEANCNFGSTLCARDAHAAADLLSRAQPAGLVEALATANIVEIVKDGRWSLSLKFGTAGEMRAASDAIRAALTSSDSPVVGEDACTCQRHPTHCANDCPQHGLSEPTYTAGERIDIPPTPTDTADRSCTCHPDDRPEGPCPQKFAASACIDTADRREAMLFEAVEPWKDFCGDLPDYDHPLRCVFESGVQYSVELLAKELGVDDWTPCDGTEEFDGDLGGTLMNIVLAAMPKDGHGDPVYPRDLPASLIAGPLPEGFVVVPVEPTEAMLAAWATSDKYKDDWRKDCAAGWSAMLAARPTGES